MDEKIEDILIEILSENKDRIIKCIKENILEELTIFIYDQFQKDLSLEEVQKCVYESFQKDET